MGFGTDRVSQITDLNEKTKSVKNSTMVVSIVIFFRKLMFRDLTFWQNELDYSSVYYILSSIQ